MPDPLFDSFRRWFEIIERRAIDPDNFASFEVWMYAQTISTLAAENQPLPPGALSMMSELNERLGLGVGASPAQLGVAWQTHFGECPEGQETLDALTSYLRSQHNAFTDAEPKRGPSLTGEEKPGPDPTVWPETDLWGKS